MTEKSCIYAASLAVAAVLIAASTGAAAQDINFACYGLPNGAGATSSVMDTGISGNLCGYTGYNSVTNPTNPTGYGVPMPDNDHLFQSYTNTGFTVSDTTGNVSMGFYDGNAYNEDQGNVLTTLGAYTRPSNVSPLQATAPPPAVPSLGFGFPAGSVHGEVATTGTIAVQSTTPGDLFTFDAVDLLDSSGAFASTYTITGIAPNSANDFTFSGTLPIENCPPPDAGCLYQSIDNPLYSNVQIDQLDITITNKSLGLTRLDNIQLTQVPEGGEGVMYLLLASGACFVAMLFISMDRPRNRNIA